jgi:glutamate-1-semialdehyde 2,1-aminomutase
MLEPSGPSGEPPFGLGEAIDPTFLQAVACETRAAGALLIFDEIITGFRTPGGSVQKETGVIPDLACFGKALANGMPLAALVGRRDVFLSMSHTAYGPTYKGDLYSLAAAKAALTSFSLLPVAETIHMIGEQLKTTLALIAREYDLPAVVVGPPFRFGLFFESEDEVTRLCLTTLYTQELLKGGLLPYKNLMLPSYAHDEEALNASTTIIRNALQCVRKAMDSNDLHSFIEIPLLQ